MRYLFAFAPLMLLCLSNKKVEFPKSITAVSNNIATVDQEKPVAVCISSVQLSLMEVTGTVTISADELEAGLSRDNSSQYQALQFSFSSNTKDQLRTFDCHDLGKQYIDLWVTDEAGNQDFCQTAIYISDKYRTCGITRQSSTLASAH